MAWALPLGTYAEFVGLVAAGWALRRAGLLTEGAVRLALRALLFAVIPASILVGAARLEPEAALSLWRLALLAAAQSALFIALALAAASRLGLDGRTRATLIFLAANQNGIFVPLPLVQAVAGEQGALAAVAYSQASFLSFLALAPLAVGRRASVAEAYAPFAPLVAALALAAVVVAAPSLPPAALVRWSLPDLAPLAAAAPWLSLLVVGASLRAAGSAGAESDRAVRWAVALRLGVGGALGVAAARLGGLPPAWRACAAVELGSPSAAANLILLERLGLDEELGARAVLASTVLSAATLPVVLALAGPMG